MMLTTAHPYVRNLHRHARRFRRLLPECRFGAVRTVLLTPHYAFKLPGRWQLDAWRWWWDLLLRGLLSNMQERRFAAEGWPQLCPIRAALPGGFLVVMPRARPLTDAEWQSLDYRTFVTRGDGYVEANFDSCAREWKQGDLGQPLSPLVLGNAGAEAGLIPAEYKRDSFGVLAGHIVAVDYG
jgi:hypothetical protein